MTRFNSICLTTILLLCSHSGFAAPVLEDQIRQCAEQTDDTQRLACYDGLLSDDRSESAPAAEHAKPKEIPLTDSIGGSTFANEANTLKTEYQGTVTSCKKGNNDRWLYFFDNEQVWKQVDRRQRRHRSCQWDVTVSKDGFGYIMRIAGDKQKIRIRRLR